MPAAKPGQSTQAMTTARRWPGIRLPCEVPLNLRKGTLMFRTSMALVTTILLACQARAADPDDKLPPPRKVPEATGPGVLYPLYYRQSHYEVWQLLDVDRFGYWRPRVVYSPNGPYWLYNGAYYPYASINQNYFKPTLVGTPYRPAPSRMPYCEE